MKHYCEIDDAKDKVIHILYAGFVCGYYNESLKECINEFGDIVTKKAAREFKENYESNCKEIV